MAVRLNRALNLVVPLRAEDGSTVHVHATPISRETFEAHWLVLSRTFALLVAEDLGPVAGPKIAYLALRDAVMGPVSGLPEQAQRAAQDRWAVVERELVGEIVRLSNVAYTDSKGVWQQIPLESAFQREVIDPSCRSEVLGQLVFFTCQACVNSPERANSVMRLAGILWGSVSTASTFTEFLSSLPTLSQDDSSGPAQDAGTAPAETGPGPARPASVPV